MPKVYVNVLSVGILFQYTNQFEQGRISIMTEKIQPGSSWNFKPLGTQIRAIAKLEAQLGIPETEVSKPSNRLEARNRIFALREERNRRNSR